MHTPHDSAFAEYRRRSQIWDLARPYPGRSPAEWRYDDDGRVIRFSEYGDPAAENGWEIAGGEGGAEERPRSLRSSG